MVTAISAATGLATNEGGNGTIVPTHVFKPGSPVFIEIVIGPRSLARPIGGFFALHEADGAPLHDSVLGQWVAGRPFVAFTNARSALAALVGMLGPPHVWLPAYFAPSLPAEAWKRKARFYPVGANLEPDTAFLRRETRAGDLVLAVDFFGYSVGPAFIAFARERSDLWFVEDRAQALSPAEGFWAQWYLYSPRKLLGVADGGILVAAGAGQPIPPCPEEPDAISLWAAPLLRYEDRSEIHNETWHAANQQKEATTTTSHRKMTRLSEWILSHTAIEPLAECRCRNWGVLRSRLGRWLAFDRDPNGIPFGFVIKVTAEQRPNILRRLHSERIFAAVHWPVLLCESEAFPEEHDLAKRLITLPCDHRYDEPSMRELGERVAEALS